MAGAPVTGALVFLAIPNKEVHAAILEAADALDGRVVVDISSNTVDVGTFDGLTMD
jgi:predicted dinucleotide-binding enzyme